MPVSRFCALLLLLSACFPYRELYRPDVNGRVIDATGAPVANAEVVSCSYTRWYRPEIECPRSATTVSDADGGFHLPAFREWEFCCLGEAPLPVTEVYTCVDGGASFSEMSQGYPEEVLLRLGEGSPRCVER